jgi:hypothetical protein
MNKVVGFGLAAIIAALALSACSSGQSGPATQEHQGGAPDTAAAVPQQDEEEGHDAAHEEAMDEHMQGQVEVPDGEPDYTYTLVTSSGDVGLSLVGRGGDIDGVRNPMLHANPGDIVQIMLVNGDGVLHDLTLDEFG